MTKAKNLWSETNIWISAGLIILTYAFAVVEERLCRLIEAISYFSCNKIKCDSVKLSMRIIESVFYIKNPSKETWVVTLALKPKTFCKTIKKCEIWNDARIETCHISAHRANCQSLEARNPFTFDLCTGTIFIFDELGQRRHGKSTCKLCITCHL